LSTLDAFLESANLRPEAAKAWVNRLNAIPVDQIQEIFAQFPPGEISQVAADFSLQMLKLNKVRLLSSIENL